MEISKNNIFSNSSIKNIDNNSLFGSNNNLFNSKSSQLFNQENDIFNNGKEKNQRIESINLNQKENSENKDEISEDFDKNSMKKQIDIKPNEEIIYDDFKYFTTNDPMLDPFRFSIEKENESGIDNKINFENNYNNKLYIQNNIKQDTKEYIMNINNKKSEENEEEEEEEEEIITYKITNNNNSKKLKNTKLSIDLDNSPISEESEEQIISNQNSTHIINNLYNKNCNHISKRKPITRKIYTNLIHQMIHLTEKHINSINEEPNKSDNAYNDIIENYINVLESNLHKMKNGYIYALVKKHFCENKIMKEKILLQENIPQKRNNVKTSYNELILLIENKLENDDEDKKYYYNVILELLHKYENITEEDLDNAKKLYKENKLESLKNIKYIAKYKENEIKNGNEITNNGWVKQIKTKKINPIKLITIALPLAFVGAYIYNFIKS